MKKLLSMLAACMLLAACSSDEVEIPRATDDSTASATSKTRSLDEAIRIAEEAGATLFAEKGRATRSVDKSRVSVITERNSRSGASDTLIHRKRRLRRVCRKYRWPPAIYGQRKGIYP